MCLDWVSHVFLHVGDSSIFIIDGLFESHDIAVLILVDFQQLTLKWFLVSSMHHGQLSFLLFNEIHKSFLRAKLGFSWFSCSFSILGLDIFLVFFLIFGWFLVTMLLHTGLLRCLVLSFVCSFWCRFLSWFFSIFGTLNVWVSGWGSLVFKGRLVRDLSC